ncbi:PIG-L family deacetylase [bacterium]|nr:PIG-L family deacetylase [bacterium]
MIDNAFAGRRVLVVAPHADDEAIGCGGLIAKARGQGAEVYILVVSVGDLVRVGDGGEKRTGSERVDEVESVRRFLGATDAEVVMTDEHRHMRLDSIPRRDLVAVLEREARLSIQNVKPHLVLLPAPSYNQDHEAVCRAGITACRPHDPRALAVPPAVWLYEYPPNSWCLPHERFIPNVYIDITQQLETKIDSYLLYQSQARAGLHQNSPDNIRTLALLRGKEVGVEAAEAYQALRLLL